MAFMEIGQKVKVRRLRQPLPQEAIARVKQNPKGEIVDYKMTDGSSIGYVVRLEIDLTTWFFEEELEAVS